MAAQVNVYVPDEMKARLDEADMPLSQIARDAWERELRSMEEAEEMGEQRIKATDRDGNEIELRFTGEAVLNGSVYRTDEGKAILLDEDVYEVWEAAEIEDNEENFADALWKTTRNEFSQEEIDDALLAFGLTPIVRL